MRTDGKFLNNSKRYSDKRYCKNTPTTVNNSATYAEIDTPVAQSRSGTVRASSMIEVRS